MTIRYFPVGIVLTIAPWNYPYLTAINSIIPALMAGNAVILKHSAQTPLCAESLAKAFDKAQLPKGVFQYLHLTHEDTDNIAAHDSIKQVMFTGSVKVGQQLQQCMADQFTGLNLELGGKDPAYVCQDADIDFSATQLADGVFYNSGQSCCAVERLYVHKNVYQPFIEKLHQQALLLKLDNPTSESTNLGPMVRTQAAEFVRNQVTQAIKQGAKALIDDNYFPASQANTPYCAPQILVNVNHDMSIMQNESFGPVVGVMCVDSDKQAIEYMNDSEFGLSASIWTGDQDRAIAIGDQVQTGTFFMNRCDYLEPALVWTGVKHSGRGYSLSKLGYQALTQAKSFNLLKV